MTTNQEFTDADYPDLFADDDAERTRGVILDGRFIQLNFMALRVSLAGLARVTADFDPTFEMFSLRVYPVNTTSFNACLDVVIHRDFAVRSVDDYQDAMQELELLLDFFQGLRDRGKPLLMYEAQEVAA